MRQKREPEITFRTLGRQELRTARWRGGNPAAVPILFFNGIGANLELAQPLAESFPDRDIITFDMPGIGGSPTPRLPYRPWWVARVAAKLLDAHGFDKVDVIGVSWGGGGAQQFAFQYPRRTRKIILAATTSGMTMVPGSPKVLSKMASPRRYVDPDYLMANFKTLYGDAESVMKDHSIRIMPPTMRGYLFQLFAMIGWTSLPFLPFLTHPTLILAGDRDKIVPLINAKILKAFIPRSELHVVKGGGHLFIIAQLAEIAPIIRDFLDRPEHATRPFAAAQPA